MKVLIIDDDEALQTIFSTALVQEKYEVITAATGQEGIQKAQDANPDLILVDQILPDMRGNDIIKQLKENDKTKDIPMIVLSNFGQNELIKEAISYGALDYILKYQIEPVDLVKRVNEALYVPGQKPDTQPNQ